MHFFEVSVQKDFFKPNSTYFT